MRADRFPCGIVNFQSPKNSLRISLADLARKDRIDPLQLREQRFYGRVDQPLPECSPDLCWNRRVQKQAFEQGPNVQACTSADDRDLTHRCDSLDRTFGICDKATGIIALGGIDDIYQVMLYE